MSIEQTSQLIQLILNSLLMTAVCVIAMGRLSIRHGVVEQQLKKSSQRFADLCSRDRPSTPERKLSQIRKSLRHLKKRHQVTHYSLLTVHYALVFAIVSTLCMGLRTLINADWLIVFSLGVFVVGAVLLLVGIGLTLLDLQASRLPLWQEMKIVLQTDKKPSVKPSAKLPRIKPLPTQSLPRMRLPPRVRVS